MTGIKGSIAGGARVGSKASVGVGVANRKGVCVGTGAMVGVIVIVADTAAVDVIAGVAVTTTDDSGGSGVLGSVVAVGSSVGVTGVRYRWAISAVSVR